MTTCFYPGCDEIMTLNGNGRMRVSCAKHKPTYYTWRNLQASKRARGLPQPTIEEYLIIYGDWLSKRSNKNTAQDLMQDKDQCSYQYVPNGHSPCTFCNHFSKNKDRNRCIECEARALYAAKSFRREWIDYGRAMAEQWEQLYIPGDVSSLPL